MFGQKIEILANKFRLIILTNNLKFFQKIPFLVKNRIFGRKVKNRTFGQNRKFSQQSKILF